MPKNKPLSLEEIQAHIEKTTSVLFKVPGHPQPKGSYDYKGRNKKTGKAVIVSQGKRALARWTSAVALVAKSVWSGPPIPKDVPVMVRALFFMPRPKIHLGGGEASIRRILKAGAPVWMTSVPDGDKLLRGLNDALAGIIFEDDRQVVSSLAEMTWEAERPRGWTGAHIWAGPCGRLSFYDDHRNPGSHLILPSGRQREEAPQIYQGVIGGQYYADE